MRLGATPCFFNSRVSKRFAALVLRRFWTISSRTYPILVDSPPQPMFLTGDANDDFVQMPDIVRTWTLPSEPADIVRAEFQSPPADCLIGNDNAALQQYFLDQAQAQRNAKYSHTAWAMISAGKRWRL